MFINNNEYNHDKHEIKKHFKIQNIFNFNKINFNKYYMLYYELYGFKRLTCWHCKITEVKCAIRPCFVVFWDLECNI